MKLLPGKYCVYVDFIASNCYGKVKNEYKFINNIMSTN